MSSRVVSGDMPRSFLSCLEPTTVGYASQQIQWTQCPHTSLASEPEPTSSLIKLHEAGLQLNLEGRSPPSPPLATHKTPSPPNSSQDAPHRQLPRADGMVLHPRIRSSSSERGPGLGVLGHQTTNRLIGCDLVTLPNQHYCLVKAPPFRLLGQDLGKSKPKEKKVTPFPPLDSCPTI